MNHLLKKALIFIVVMALAAGACWVGRKAYKKSMEHHLLAQAHQYAAKKDWRATSLCLQRVLQINPFSLEGCRMIADVLEAQGSPAALSWRIRVAKLQTDNFTNRLAWAETALKLEDLQSASTALDGLDTKAKQTAQYHKIAGALAWGLHQPAQAETEYLQALALEPTNQVVVFNLATIRLVSTNTTVAEDARASLEQMASNPELRIMVLRYLMLDAVAHKSLAKAVVYSQEMLQSPSATFTDKVKHLELLRAAASQNYSSWYATLKKLAATSPTNTVILGNWMLKSEGPANTLRWLQSLPLDIQTNQPVPLLVADCEIGLKRWDDLLGYVSQQNWGKDDYYRLTVKSLAMRSLGQPTAAENEWRKSLNLATHQPESLIRLTQITSTWGWVPERTEVLEKITDEFPTDKWAVQQLIIQRYKDGDTYKLQQMLEKLQTEDPADTRVKNDLANVLMLRNTELDKAYRLAREAYAVSSDDPFVISTYAYSLMMQGKSDEAVKLLNGLKPDYLQIPSIAAYYGVIQAGSGHKDLARPCLERADQAKLLPEETKMVRLAKASL